MNLKLLSVLLAFVLALPLPAVAGKKNDKKDIEKIGERDVGKGMNWYSLEKEIAIGKRLAQQVESQSRIVNDPVVAEYVNRVGQNLVRNSDAKVPFTIKVIDAEEINAFALPGGFFFVNSGLILEAEEEAELAGVMAHEIAHVAARHGTRQATRGQLAQFLTLPLIFVGGGIGYGARGAASLLVPLGFLKFSRSFEREADFLGLQYMYKTGYDPQGFVTFFEKIQAKEKKRPGLLAKAFRSHPQTPDRIARTQQQMSGLPDREEHLVTTSEFDEVRLRLEAIHYRRRLEDRKSDRPTLRKSTTADTRPVDEKGRKEDEGEEDDEDRPPKLKRRD